MTDRSVVITGLGIISAAGATATDLWHSILERRSAVCATTVADLRPEPVLACRVPTVNVHPDVAGAKVSKFFLREDLFGASAARAAIADASLPLDRVDLTRGGLFVASGKEEVPAEEIADAMRACLEGGEISPRLLGSLGLRVFHPLSLLRVMPNTGQFGISALFGFRGPNLNLVASGAAGGQAVGEAFRSLREESCDFALAGAQDSRIDPISIAAFQCEGILSKRTADPRKAMRPFDASRDGFALGEGAACVLLETMTHAQTRGARPRAKVTGYGTTKDSDGRGIARAIESSLADAGLAPSRVDVVFAWGDCTVRGDLEEAMALREVFGPQVRDLPVCCIKPITGNMLGASATAELAVAVLALESMVIPPTMNHRTSDPQCGLSGLSDEPRPRDLTAALCLSRGLHGQSVALTLERL